MPFTRHGRSWLLVIVGILAVALVVGACSSGTLNDGAGAGSSSSSGGGPGTCGPGRAGCACSTPGQTVGCGHVVNQFGDYVTCSQGNSTCQNGVWGACLGNTIYTKSLTSSTLGGGGIRVQSNTQTCADPCDPNSCTQIAEGPGDVDAAGLVVNEGGVSIPPTVTQGGTTSDAGACSGLQCQVDWTCPKGKQTTLTGTVYDPAGNNPLYNAYVYIPVDPSGNLPPFSSGASCDPCAGVSSFNAVVVAQTDVYGHFTLLNVPTTALAPNNQIPLVIQMGKWRRLEMLPSVPDCTTTAIAPANSRLPRNKFDGYNNTADIPKMAIATGNVDPMECMMLKMGIDPAEFQIPATGTRRIDFYQANGLPFNGGTAPPESQLATGACSTATCYQNSDCTSGNTCTSGALGKCAMKPSTTCSTGSAGTQCKSGTCSGGVCTNEPSCDPNTANSCGTAETCSNGTAGTCSCVKNGDCTSGTCSLNPLMNYDVVLLPCEGFEDDGNDKYATNIADYALAGGRLFTTHYGYTWLSTPTNGTANATNPTTNVSNPFFSVANWNLNKDSYGSAGAQIDTGFPKGLAFEQWMDNINAATSGAITLNSPRHDVDSVNASYSTEWMHHSSSPNETFHFTFNTPLGAGIGDAGAGDGGAGLCGRVVYSDFHVSATALQSGNSCASSADCGFGETCNGGSYGTCSAQSCKTTSDCGDPKFTCNSTAGTCGCTKTSDCVTMNAGTCVGATLANCGCYSNADCSAMNAGTCQNAGNGTCGCYETSDCTKLNAGTCTGNTHGTCGTSTCYQNSDCSSGEGICHNPTKGKCSIKTCYQNSDCGAGPATCHSGSLGTCKMQSGKSCTVANQATQCASGMCGNNNKCQNEPSCDPNKASACGSVETCSNATAGACYCYQNSDCASEGAGTCSGSSAGNCGCYESSDCAALGAGSCSGQGAGTCTGLTCGTNADCSAAGNGSCSGSTPGTCSAATCASNSDCSAGNKTCTGSLTSGQCSTATCTANSNCTAGTKTCTGYKSGTCSPNACTSNNNCGLTSNGQERCSGGTCKGCISSQDCPGGNQNCQGATTGTCTGNSNAFPGACAQGPLSPQESALEFMLLDLTACISPDNQAPPAPAQPVTTYSPVTFTEDFSATCPMGTHVVWRELDWQATIPSTASIVFTAKTVEPPADGAAPSYSGVQSVVLATATTSTALPGWDAALIDATGIDGGQAGAFNTASPPVTSKSDLHLKITLNPTSDMMATPTLIQWQVKSDCPPSE